MKLELNSLTPSQSVEKSAKKSPDSTEATTASAAGSTLEDRTTFQSDAKTVQSLVTQALATPAVRQDRVDAIRQSISNGTFTFDAGKVADAMIAQSKQS